MRLVCAQCFCDEVGPETYRANKITQNMVLPGWQGAFRWMDLMYPLAGGVRPFMSSTEFHKSNNDQNQTVFEFVYGKAMWKVLDEIPEQRHNFDLFMAERKKNEETRWYKRYPPSASLKAPDLKSDQDAVLMVDVGGAYGSQLIDFRKQYPHLHGRCILQDLPSSVELFEPSEGIEKMGYDFFTPQPIKGARFYYLRSILHNWPEKECIEILRNVAAAMDPDYSTLLIDDFVLPAEGVQLSSAISDIHMMLMFNSSERTSEKYEKILHAVGLEILAIFPGVNEYSTIEARLVKQ